ncbi:MAG: FAD-dependent pyridine nucleotide-disulfide oxidoreductase [Chthoniobacter sp.]|nr:FAD-dependent pyridine nucleotide-disulfide oxidoreductase [Chthoniobacter sp.]
MIRRDYLIVGAGVAGVSVCEGVREHDSKGTIMMVGNESAYPYDRSALLKAYLSKGSPPLAGSLQLHEPDWYEKQKIDLRLDTIVTQLNLERRVAVLANGQAIEFRKACMATGSRARRPQVAGATLGNVFYVRSLRDVQALREVAENERQMVVIGGGLIGAESAALLSKFPKAQVTYMHRGPAIWNRTLDPETAAWLTEYYRQQGVQMMMSEALNGFEGRTVLKNVQTKSGHRVAAGLAIAALGAEPNLGLMVNTPLAYPHGTPVNEYLETDEKGIFAAGDIAAFPDKIFSGVRRVDHSPCPQEQGRVAGANMTGKKRIKWDWVPHYTCNLFDLQFDFVGDFNGPPTRIELEGERAKKKFVVRHHQLAQLRGVVLCNQPPDKIDAAKKQIREWPRGKKPPGQG